MVFWIVITLIACAVAAILVLGTRRTPVEAVPEAYDLKVYRDQLAEVDRDLARGIVNPEDAERTRTEIARRILAADAAQDSASPQTQTTRSGNVWLAVGAGAFLVAGSVALYTALGVPGYGDLALDVRIETAEQMRAQRPDQAAAEKSVDSQQRPPIDAPSAEYLGLVAQLRSVVEDRPNDPRGLRLLAISERNLGNYTAAHEAFSRYLDLRGDAAQPGEFVDLADMLILAAGGYVSPEAEQAIAVALQGDPANGPARYFEGLMHAQTGRPDRAFQIWDRLLRIGPADAPWIQPIQAQIDEMAIRAGVRYSQPVPGASSSGPSADDVAAAGELSASERLEMIEGMVSGLAERLSSEGGTVEDWARLITSLGVLGRTNDAFSVYQNAVQVFAEDPAAMDVINRAGDQAGVAN